MHRLLALAGLVLFLPLLNAADSPQARPLAELIRDLAANDFTVRAAAIRAIEARGPDVLPELRQHQDHADPEVRRLIQQWIPRFETDALVRPRRVTMQFADRPLSEAVALLARQTGYSLELAADESLARRRCTIRLEQATFWEALQQIGQAGRVEAELDGTPTLTLNPSDSHYPFVYLHGAFRLRATGINYNAYSSTRRTIPLGPIPRQGKAPVEPEQKQDSRTLLFHFSVAAEPRLTMAGAGMPILSEAVDDRGQSLLPNVEGHRAGTHVVGFAGGRFPSGMVVEHNRPLQLLAPAAGARTIQRLRGSIPVYLVKSEQTTVLLDSLKDIRGKKVQVGSSTIEIDHFKANGQGRYALYVTMTRKQPANDDGADLPEDGLELLDDQGESFQVWGSGTSGDENLFQAHFIYGPPFNGGKMGAPAKLVYVRSQTVEYQVPFEFRDLPLP